MIFTPVKIDWSIRTLILYLLIIVGCYGSVNILKNKVLIINTYRKKKVTFGFLFAAIVLIFFKGFGTTGRDLRAGYYNNFLSAISLSKFYDYTVEFGYRLLNVIIRNFTIKYSVFIFVIGLLTVLPVIYMIWKYREKIDVSAALLFYTSIFYFPGFSILRAYLASSMSLIAFNAMVEKKIGKAFIWLCIAISIHRSMVFLMVPFFFIVFDKINKKMIVCCLILFFAFVLIGRGILANYFANSERYSLYSIESVMDIGMEQFIYYIPLFILLYLGKDGESNPVFFRVSFCYLTSGFTFGLLGYVIPIIGRVQYAFLSFVIILPYYIRLIKIRYSKYKYLLDSMVAFYCIARFLIYIVQYYNLDDLMPYTNIWGWLI